MEENVFELNKKIENLILENQKLKDEVQSFSSAKQSLNRMSVRLKKLCKRLDPTNEIVEEMQKISAEIKENVNKIT